MVVLPEKLIWKIATAVGLVNSLIFSACLLQICCFSATRRRSVSPNQYKMASRGFTARAALLISPQGDSKALRELGGYEIVPWHDTVHLVCVWPVWPNF
jgi:hypothetical protein